MRKVAFEKDNPIDYLLYSICESIEPYLRKSNWTPNLITTFRLLILIICVICVIRGWYIIAALLWMFYYFLDCLDGFFARTNNMYTKFGDLYDHIVDLVGFVTIFILIYFKYKVENRTLFITISIIMILFLLIHTGCEIKNFEGKNKDDFLNYTMNFCPNDKWIKYTRYMGAGTFNMFIMFVIIFLKFQ